MNPSLVTHKTIEVWILTLTVPTAWEKRGLHRLPILVSSWGPEFSLIRAEEKWEKTPKRQNKKMNQTNKPKTRNEPKQKTLTKIIKNQPTKTKNPRQIKYNQTNPQKKSSRQTLFCKGKAILPGPERTGEQTQISPENTL